LPITPQSINPVKLVRRLRPRQPSYANVGAIRWLPGLGLGLPKAGFRGAPNPRLPEPLGRLGSLEIRLAKTGTEVRRAQRLRYDIFYGEMSAVPSGAVRLARRDMDEFDAICDHLLVIDHDAPPAKGLRRKGRVVGTYRLLRQEVADINWGFYTAAEFDLAPLVEARPDLRFLELGRSCVMKQYRDKRTVELLWHGIWVYVLAHGVNVMLGCASLEGTDPDAIALPLSYLHHYHRPPDEWRIRALPDRYVEMNRMPKEAIDVKAALRSLPPLIKGYLRIGGYVGEGAVVDHEFGTTDVFMILPVSAINPRYVNYYGADASRHAV
jgi:putative hemolysin